MLLSDQFDLYDETLDVVCDEFGIEDRPAWQHRWFYRFLQISPSYSLAAHIEMAREDNQEINMDAVSIEWPESEKVLNTYALFKNVWKLDLTRWWFLYGRFQFSNHKKSKISEIADIFLDKLIGKEEFLKFTDNFDNSLADLYLNKTSRRAVILSIPITSSKKTVMKMFEKYLDEKITFGQPEVIQTTFPIMKSKLREKTLRDCYRALEVRVRNPKLSLIGVAKKAKTLRTAFEDLKDDDSDVAQSVRSGISRQLRMAYILAENAARGRFPDAKNRYKDVSNMYTKNWTNFYDHMIETQSLKSQTLASMRRDIPTILELSRKYGLNNSIGLD